MKDRLSNIWFRITSAIKRIVPGVTLTAVTFGFFAGSWYLLEPETYWHRLISMFVAVGCGLLPAVYLGIEKSQKVKK